MLPPLLPYAAMPWLHVPLVSHSQEGGYVTESLPKRAIPLG